MQLSAFWQADALATTHTKWLQYYGVICYVCTEWEGRRQPNFLESNAKERHPGYGILWRRSPAQTHDLFIDITLREGRKESPAHWHWLLQDDCSAAGWVCYSPAHTQSPTARLAGLCRRPRYAILPQEPAARQPGHGFISPPVIGGRPSVRHSLPACLSARLPAAPHSRIVDQPCQPCGMHPPRLLALLAAAAPPRDGRRAQRLPGTIVTRRRRAQSQPAVPGQQLGRGASVDSLYG
jgi:hypothetical protein